ncbi:hypothetical protein BDZ89DRAFT_1068855 [Hymenopellis radicata]|nr:hypothetical protein BDZ89DRAFT_1068855 [Hymenopellis radicata]
MSSDMRLQFKSLTASASSRIKGYVSQKDPRSLAAGTEGRQTWKEWAGEKINSRRGQSAPAIEKVAVFPGWAARKYASGTGNADEPFEVDVYISGFATSHRPPELASRSQRAFMRLAKSFAALPKLEGDPDPAACPSQSTEDLLRTVRLPARPEDMTEEFEISDELKKFHANLESRLQPFWSSVLQNRIVSIQLFPKPLNATQDPMGYGPIAEMYVNTGVDGSFQARFAIRWEDMCQHPGAVHIAFGQASDEHEVLAHVKLLPVTSASNSSPSLLPPPPLVATSARIPLTHSPIRVISDIDDTVKHSDVLGGARTVFRNVFVKELTELVIPGMGDWYTRMFAQGVRFHYVSNGPFELLPILGDFFTVARLPPGSIKLRSYAGRSLFSGLLSAPAARKRAAVQDIRQQRPDQILAVFIRQADEISIDDPTGTNASREVSIQSAPPALDTYKRRGGSSSMSSLYSYPSRTPAPPSQSEYFGNSIPMTFEPEPMPLVNTAPTSPSTLDTSGKTTDEEKKKYELQMRVWSARMQIPGIYISGCLGSRGVC